ncbi:hypothetical protein [Streptomyces niveus]|uniref:hypothetical protein n=1 Tax=Streptomyces niveus TaxID=193462 RepID=UPI0003C5B26C|nr:hypothetical protein [Streptomyces niveus]EST18646.1 hypothetical protein M877_38305 [Streptomyces niveus NCIMB 11891]
MSGSAATEFTSVQSQYEVQVAGDLERNEAEQKRICAEIDTLQGQLETLERDHALLLGVQRVFAEGARPGAVRGAKTPAKRASAKASAKAGTAGKQPSLAQLLGTLLAAHGEPRSAAEISAELAADHPRRNSNVNVVRNALELLVAKSQAHRSKQNNSVFYTHAGRDAAPASD